MVSVPVQTLSEAPGHPHMSMPSCTPIHAREGYIHTSTSNRTEVVRHGLHIHAQPLWVQSIQHKCLQSEWEKNAPEITTPLK